MEALAVKEPRVWVPEISDKRLIELTFRIKPVIRSNDVLHYIKPVHLRDIAYTWSPTFAGLAPDVKKLCDIKTYHRYGAPSFFKPSIAEVLAAIPEERLDEVIAFEILDTVEPLSDHEAANAGYHVALTRLYTRA